MEKLISPFRDAKKYRHPNSDDFADRLSSRYSIIFFVTFSLVVFLIQYIVRYPIHCWAPNHFTKAQIAFTEKYCWVKGTYYLPWDKAVPKDGDERQMIPYYQWVPFILLAQAVFFYLPCVIWHGLNSRAGVDADNILSAAHTLTRTDRVENRDRTMKMLINQIDRFLDNRAKKIRCRCDVGCVCKLCNACGRRVGYYLLTVFLMSKLCYIANVIAQLFILNSVLSTTYSTFGFDIAREMASNRDWTEDSYVAFPRVTLCDFKVRGQDMHNVHPYTVQCVLPINLYNEKIYMFLWFWMYFVAAASVISLLTWVVRASLVRDRIRFVKNHLQLGEPLEGDTEERSKENTDNKACVDSEGKGGTVDRDKNKVNAAKRMKGNNDIKEFTTKFLKQDGCLLLRLIAHNTNNITTTEVTWALWEVWTEKTSLLDVEDQVMAVPAETESILPHYKRSPENQNPNDSHNKSAAEQPSSKEDEAKK